VDEQNGIVSKMLLSWKLLKEGVKMALERHGGYLTSNDWGQRGLSPLLLFLVKSPDVARIK
jgi:hypothetical protein